MAVEEGPVPMVYVSVSRGPVRDIAANRIHPKNCQARPVVTDLSSDEGRLKFSFLALGPDRVALV